MYILFDNHNHQAERTAVQRAIATILGGGALSGIAFWVASEAHLKRDDPINIGLLALFVLGLLIIAVGLAMARAYRDGRWERNS